MSSVQRQRFTTVFKNLKTQSQCLMTLFRNAKTNQRFTIIFDIVYWYKKIEVSLGRGLCTRKKLKHTQKWTKKRLKVTLVVLHVVKSHFPETKEFIDNTLKEECEKKNHCR